MQSKSPITGTRTFLLTLLTFVGTMYGSLSSDASPLSRPTDPNYVVLKMDRRRAGPPLEKVSENSTYSSEELVQQIRDSLENYRRTSEPQNLMSGRLSLKLLRSKATEQKETAYFTAVFLQQEHKFDEAVATLDDLLRKYPTYFDARILKAGILLVQGNAEAANKECRGLLQYGDELLTYACSTAASSTSETLSANVERLEKILASNQSRSDDAVWRWANSIAADLADRNGEPARAAKMLEYELSSTSQKSTLALVQLADLYLRQERYSDLDKLLEPYVDVDALLLRRVLALMALSDPRVEEMRALLADRMATFEASDARQHARELSMYYLGVVKDPARALHFAKESFSYQKETIDYRNFRAAALAAHDSSAASSVSEEAARRKYADVIFSGPRS